MELDPQQNLALDFAALRTAGLELIQRLAGETWTDHNTHDPGITILEQFCYALTDLSYRSQYALPDLLAGTQTDTAASLYTPAQILPTNPVTVADLRKLVIDVPGVKNAWIEIVDEPSASYSGGRAEVSYTDAGHGTSAISSANPNTSEVRIKGLYRVQIEKSDLVDIDGGVIRREAARRLNGCRGLCEDFQSIEVLDFQPIRLDATLEIDSVSDATALLANVYQAISAYLSPSVPFHTLAQLLARGLRVDEIFEGPLLGQGFITDEDLALMNRRNSLRISDLIHELMAIPGIAAVKNLHFLTPDRQPSSDWLFSVDADKTPRFDLQNSDIRLERRGLRVDQAIQSSAQQLFVKLASAAASPAPTAAIERDLHPQAGRDRNIASYYSVQHQFPMTYGIGSAGLAQSAPPARRAQAKQLKAYMMFYDQLLANHFAQLANVGKLFSFQDETADSYFSLPVVDDGTLGLDDIRISGPEEHAAMLRQITEDPLSDAFEDRSGAQRRNRFLDHLLARFGEQFRDYSLLQAGVAGSESIATDERLARDKRAFLRDYPSIGRHRGTAINYLEDATPDNISGLELTLRRKLGVSDPEERFYVIEHILLRPLAGDANQTGPMFRAAQARDPYSLQVSVVFPDWPQRFQDENFRQFVEQTVREETPAHLTPYILWKDKSAMQAFVSAHGIWMSEWRKYRMAELGF